MIGSGLKKLAQGYGLKVAKGVAYGNLGGFAATLFEGPDYKQIVFATGFADADQKTAFQQSLESTDLNKQFRVQKIGFGPKSIQIVFFDTVGTMKKIEAFLEWFLPLLREHSATAYNICPECGTEITNGRWLLINGIAFYLHDACAEKTKRTITETNENEKQEREGSYALGAVGALLGSLVGAVAWALVLNFGFVASVVGFVIGWLAEKGYNLLKGKQGKGKVVILIIAVILGVLLGTFASEMITAIDMVNNGEIYGITVGDVPALILLLLIENAEYRLAVLGNVAMGLLFAGLGVFGLLKKAGDEASGTKVVELN